jgi:large repetitive protein
MRMITILSLLGACRSEVKPNPEPSDEVEVISDLDADGYDTESDCDDNDATINPGEEELCDGVDNNCDGEVDEGVLLTFYLDEDADGFGDAENSMQSCEQGAGYVPNANDCDDGDASVYAGAPEVCDSIDNDCNGEIDENVNFLAYVDSDGDGQGDPELSQMVCEYTEGLVDNSDDCDDANNTVYLDAPEHCDGIDNDCDEEIDEDGETLYYLDQDGDGFGDDQTSMLACSPSENYAAVNGDCDDIEPTINPIAIEICDGVDNNCDGNTDDSTAVGQQTFYYDLDSDGYGDPINSVDSCSQLNSTVLDDTDCDDTDPAVNPAASEICNGIDDDCNTLIDEDDPALSDGIVWGLDLDGDGFGSSSVTVESCTQPSGYVSDMTDCNDLEATAYPGATEICDSIDNDCDGDVDDDDSDTDSSTFTEYYADLDSDGYGDPNNTLSQCDQPSGYLTDNSDCDDTNLAVYPLAIEVCDGLDNDCDGDIDDDDSSLSNALMWGLDLDGDGFGSSSVTVESCAQPSGYVSDMTDCNDLEVTAYPGATEICDGVDNDCDGDIDDDDSNVDTSTMLTYYIDLDGDGYGDATVSMSSCTQPVGYVLDDSDCDDTDPAINPDVLWYADVDLDGYGSSNYTLTACTQPSGYISDGTDCDDTDYNINPAADEVCDSVDNDCDGDIDDDDASLLLDPNNTWYADVDLDGYGNASSTTNSCSQPTGYVSDNTDCNDGDFTINPGATEICDGIDNDCDGASDIGAQGSDPSCAALSCLDILNAAPGSSDDVYWIDPDGSGAYQVYCDMTNGGWTLMMKSMLDNTELIYDASLWDTNTTLNETDFSISGGDNSKYQSYNNLPFSEIRIDMNGYDQSFEFPAQYNSMLAIMTTGGAYVSFPTSAGQAFNPSYWGFSNLGHESYHCYNFGINQDFYGDGGIARLGFQLSQEYGCSHPGTSEGVGLKERNNNDYLNSGRLQWSTEVNYFSPALIFIR